MANSANHPRRLTPPAAPGSMLKQFGRAPETHPSSRSVKHQGERLPDHLAKIRLLPCLYCGVQPCGEAAHVRFANALFGTASGLGKKPRDRLAVPLCAEDHRNARHAQHQGNEEAFWIALGIEPYAVAARLWEQRQDFAAMENVVRVAIAERSKT